MAIAHFRFHGELTRFLARERREVSFAHACARAATLKNAVEALGVPHTEAAELRVNGERATLDRIVREGDAIEVFPWSVGGLSEPAPAGFLADAHLGALARFLRMLGFDTLHHNAFADEEIRTLARTERRLVLTRDRELLKCRDIARGCFVHAIKPEAQLREVAGRYGLARHARPFTLCLHCSLPLEQVERETVEARLPERVAERHERFTLCPGCDRVYWPGSHYERMRRALGTALSAEILR
jgi:uncharacterized protein with PIN domain